MIFSVRASDKRIHCDEEFSDSEDEMSGPNEAGGRRDRTSHKPKHKRPKTDDEKKAEGAKCKLSSFYHLEDNKKLKKQSQ
jgi:histone deacetylase 1/2